VTYILCGDYLILTSIQMQPRNEANKHLFISLLFCLADRHDLLS